MDRVWVGADPGGIGRFGLAFLAVSGEMQCRTVSTVAEAAQQIVAAGEPMGVGIDAPMWWSAGPGGGRRADERLRSRYGISSGTVQSVNSLRGAALVARFDGQGTLSRRADHRVASEGALAGAWSRRGRGREAVRHTTGLARRSSAGRGDCGRVCEGGVRGSLADRSCRRARWCRTGPT